MCGLELDHDGTRVTSVRPDPDDVFSAGFMCPKGVALTDLHDDPDRLRTPMIREGRTFREASWEEALNVAADRLHSVYKARGPEAIALYHGNPVAHSYGAAMVSQLIGPALRTRSFYSASSMDQLPHMFAAWQMFGHQLLMPVPDLDRTELFVILGGNPVVSNGSIMSAPGMPQRLKELRARGGELIVIDPRLTETARLADLHLPIRPGTDAMLLLALLHVIFAEHRVAEGPWRDRVRGLDRLQTVAAGWPPARVARATGIDADTIVDLARRIARPRVAVYGRMGVCTQRYGGVNAWLLYALNVVTGNLDAPGGMMRPEPPVDLLVLARLLGKDGGYDRFRTRVHGLPEVGGELPIAALAEEIETRGAGQLRGLLTVAGNPALSAPNAGRLQGALGRLDAMVSIDYYLNETTCHAHVILPPESPLERDHFDVALLAFAVRSIARYSEPTFTPSPEVRSDFDILLDLLGRVVARRGGLRDRAVAWGLGLGRRIGKERLLDLLIRVGPHGAWRPGGRHRLTLDHLRRRPHGIDLGPMEPSIFDRVATPDGLVRLDPDVCLADLHRLEDEAAANAAPGLLLIGRRHLRSNNSWLHNSERLVRGKDRCTLQIHPDDAGSRGIADGDSVRLASRVGRLTTRAEVTDAVMPGVVSMPHGWGHDQPGARLSVAAASPGQNVNRVTDDHLFDTLTCNAALNGVPVTVERVPAANGLETEA